METATDHYVKHLGPVYCWMVGDLQTASVRAVSELDALGLPREARGSAVDLGAGFGLYALPLARRGYNVTAIDSWLQRVSSYSKLRLHPEWVAAKLAAQGLITRVGPGPAGMVCVVAIKP
jgi:2-polyprenyl-3-methyl-5-hydroxy-6-metoxy-1,4-benzoquinol methylase